MEALLLPVRGEDETKYEEMFENYWGEYDKESFAQGTTVDPVQIA